MARKQKPSIKYDRHSVSKDIPLDASANDIGNMVTAVLCLPGTVVDLRVKRGEGSSPSVIEWEYMIPKAEPPDGEVPDPPSEDIWQTLSRVPVKEVTLKGHNLDLGALNQIVSMLLHASRKKLVGVAWAIGDVRAFKAWLGLRSKRAPSRLLGIPLVLVQEIPSDRMVLLAARGTDVGPFDAEIGFSVAMLKKERHNAQKT